MTSHPQFWPAGMDRKEQMLSILRDKDKLGFNHIRSLEDLEQMKQVTLHKKLEASRAKLTDRNVASICTRWLQGQNTKDKASCRVMVEEYCQMIAYFGCERWRITMMWNDCVSDAVNCAPPTMRAHIKTRLDGIGDAMRANFARAAERESKLRQSSLPASNALAKQLPASTKQKENVPLVLKTPGSPQQPTHVHPMFVVPTKIEPPKAPDSLSSIPQFKPDPVIIDLTKDLPDPHTPRRLTLDYWEDLEENMVPPRNYVCYKCNRKGR